MTAHRGWIDNTRGPLDVDWPEEVSGAESDRAMSLTFANERAAATVAQTDPRTAVSRYLNGWTRDSRVAGALSPNAAAITTAAYTVPDTTIIKDIARWSTTYEASWVGLSLGNTAGAVAESGVFDSTETDITKTQYVNQPVVTISGERRQLDWTTDDKEHVAYEFINCGRVVIDDCQYRLLDEAHGAAGVFRFYGCDEIIITNVRISGAMNRFAIDIRYAGDVFMDRVDISGRDYGVDGIRGGGGIAIKAAQTGASEDAVYALQPGWWVLQNIYIHDMEVEGAEASANYDGILLHHPYRALVFNYYAENLVAGVVDSCLDVSWRDHDSSAPAGFVAPDNGFLRIERFVADTCGAMKCTGNTPITSTGHMLVMANSVLLNTLRYLYSAAQVDLRFLASTFTTEADAEAPYMIRAGSGANSFDSPLTQSHCAMYLDDTSEQIYKFVDAGKLDHITSDYNAWWIQSGVDIAKWFKCDADGGEDLDAYADWVTSGNDIHSFTDIGTTGAQTITTVDQAGALTVTL